MHSYLNYSCVVWDDSLFMFSAFDVCKATALTNHGMTVIVVSAKSEGIIVILRRNAVTLWA